MARINSTSVIIVNAGVVSAVHAFDNFDEAAEHFKACVREEEEDVTEDELLDMVDNGVYTDMVGGVDDIYLVTSEA